MKHNRTIRAAGYPAFQVGYLVIALALCLYFFGCDDDPPTGPVDPEPSGYKVYFYDRGDHPQYWSWDPETGKLDTVMLPVRPYSQAAVSPDGKTMFVTRTDQTVAVMDIRSRTLIANLPYKAEHGIAVSPDGSLLSLQDEELYILTLPDFEVYYHDTVDVWGGIFSANSRAFFCSLLTTERCVGYRLDLDDTTDVWKHNFSTTTMSFSVRYVMPSPDEREYYAYLWYGSFDYWFAVYDVAGDSVYFADHLNPGHGQIAVHPGGRYVVYNSPGLPIGDWPPLYGIKVFDAETRQPAPTISTVLDIDGNTVEFVPSDICFTPDGKWLLAITDADYDIVVVISMETLQIDQIIRLGGNNDLAFLVCPTAQ